MTVYFYTQLGVALSDTFRFDAGPSKRKGRRLRLQEARFCFLKPMESWIVALLERAWA